MDWFSILVRYGPAAYGLVREIYRLIHSRPEEKHLELKDHLKRAHHHYKLTKSKKELRSLKKLLEEQD